MANVYKQIIDKDKNLYFNKELAKDPSSWLELATAYHQLYTLVNKQSSVDDIRNPEKNRVCLTLPYIASIAAELYMKGFLISCGKTPSEVTNIGHDLVALRRQCISEDKRFGSSKLDNFIEFESLINMPNGGIRYPRSHVFMSGSHHEDSLDILRLILEEKIGTD